MVGSHGHWGPLLSYISPVRKMTVPLLPFQVCEDWFFYTFLEIANPWQGNTLVMISIEQKSPRRVTQVVSGRLYF